MYIGMVEFIGGLRRESVECMCVCRIGRGGLRRSSVECMSVCQNGRVSSLVVPTEVLQWHSSKVILVERSKEQ